MFPTVEIALAAVPFLQPAHQCQQIHITLFIYLLILPYVLHFIYKLNAALRLQLAESASVIIAVLPVSVKEEMPWAKPHHILIVQDLLVSSTGGRLLTHNGSYTSLLHHLTDLHLFHS